MEVADRVRAAGQAEREGRHVELRGVAIDPEPQVEDILDGHAAVFEEGTGDAPHEIGVEPLVAGRDRGVDGEHAVASDVGPGVGECPACRDVLAGALGEEERGVPLVEMPDGGGETERPDGPHAADAQDQLLVEAHLTTADVQDVGDRPVGFRVLRHIRIEQEDRHPADLGDPDRDEQVASGQLDGHRQGQAGRILDAPEREAGQVVIGVVVLLVAVGIDGLAEVTLAIQQADPDRRQGHVAGGLHVVAGEDTQAARVDAERLVEPVLGAEIGDRPGQPVGVLALEPVVGAVGHVRVELVEDVVVLGQELRVVEQPRPVDGAADDRDRAAVPGPAARIDPVEQAAGARMPRPVKVVGETPESFESGREEEARRRDRRDADGVHEAASYPVVI